MHLGLDDPGNLFACGFADALDGLPAFAKHDLALTFALYINGLLDADVAGAQLLPDLGLNRRVVRQFLVQPLEQFLAGDFGGKLSDWRIRHLISWIKPWPGRNALRKPGFEIRNTVAGQRRNHEGRFEPSGRVGRLRQIQQRFLRHHINLVEDQHLRWPYVSEFAENAFRLLVQPFAGINEHADQISLMRAAPRRRHHGAVEPPPRRKYAGRVDENELRLASNGNAADQSPRRLHFVRYDTDLGADQCIKQRRFAGIRRTDQG